MAIVHAPSRTLDLDPALSRKVARVKAQAAPDPGNYKSNHEYGKIEKNWLRVFNKYYLKMIELHLNINTMCFRSTGAKRRSRSRSRSASSTKGAYY